VIVKIFIQINNGERKMKKSKYISGVKVLFSAALVLSAVEQSSSLEKLSNIKARDGENRMLRYAAERGDVKEVEYWICCGGAKVDTAYYWGVTLLHYAAESGHTAVIEFLLKHRAYVDAATDGRGTPLHYAAFSGHMDAVKCLMDHGASAGAVDTLDRTPLHLAVWSGHEDIVRFLVEYEPLGWWHHAHANVNAGGAAGTALHDAARNGHRDIVEYLVKNGADINVFSRWERSTPLHMAAWFGHGDVVKYLVKHGADINAADKRGETPLHDAARFGHVNIVNFLVESGANIDAIDMMMKETPLHYAAQFGYVNTVSCLVLHGADINASNSLKRTPLSNAISSTILNPVCGASPSECAATVNFLMDNGAVRD
jgi:cytohesin